MAVRDKFAEMSDNELLSRLHLQCGMTFRCNATPEQLAAMLEFGRWLLQRHHPAGWYGDFAAEQWLLWQRELEAQRANAVVKIPPPEVIQEQSLREVPHAANAGYGRA